MTRAMLRSIRALGALLVVPPALMQAQIRASEVGTVSQVMDGTKITVQYSRPRARGRDPIFGTKAVHWDEVWTPGANYATTLETSKGVKLDGHAVPKGRYSVWFVVRQTGDWTLVLDPQDRRYHMNPPDSSATQVRFPVHVDSAAFTDVLTWSFPELRADGGTLAFQWERKRVALRVEVEPSLTVTMAAADALPYLGRFEYADKDRQGKPITAALVVTYDDTAHTMKAQFDPYDAYMGRFAMIRVAPDWFVPGLYDKDGKIYEVYRPEMVFQFTRAGARAATLDLRDENDSLQFHASRKP